MEQTFKATEINVGFHPAGYRIDKTASPIEARYYGKETRLGKVVLLVKELSGQKVGLAFCIGLGEVANIRETGYFLVK